MAITPNPTLLWFVIVYCLIMVILGIWYSRRITNSDDFILAGRSLGPIVLTGTLLATFVGSGTVTGGVNSLAYSYGFWVAGVAPILISFFGFGHIISHRTKNSEITVNILFLRFWNLNMDKWQE